MSQVLIHKPKGTPLLKKEVCFEIIFKNPYYISFAYPQKGKIKLEKYSNSRKGDIDKAWARLANLTDESLIAFFQSYKEKVIEKYADNLNPILINEDLAYVSVGGVLSLSKKQKASYTDSYFLKKEGLEVMAKEIPNVFFLEAGKWLIEEFVPSTTGLAFIKSDGDVSLINEENGSTFKNLWFFDPELAKKAKKTA